MSTPAPHVTPVVIAGSTGVGKSGLAVHLAKRLTSEGQAAEIINADSFSMYRGMDIGTAKVTAAERAEIPHHLIDVLDVWQDASVAEYQAEGRAVLHALQDRGVRPIIVGGSGLYIRALLDHLDFPGTDPNIRERLEAEDVQIGTGLLYKRLAELDPAAAESIDSKNARRIIRALEVIELTGAPYSSRLPRHESIQPAIFLALRQDWQRLDPRIDSRVEEMWAKGFVAEVRELATTIGTTARRAVGYRQILDFLAGQITEEEAYASTQQTTRRLARKQFRWFDKDPRYHWLDVDDPQLRTQAWAQIHASRSTTTHGPVQ